MNLNIHNVTNIEVGPILPLEDSSQESRFYRLIKLTYGRDKESLIITALTDNKFDCEEAAKKNLGVELA
tara:strand:+ start:346 stop:552 length:207 start_codon:yes stop_codon:yes gene_type:complete